MDSFTNIFSPISYWTDINSTLAAYNNDWYSRALTSSINYSLSANPDYIWNPFGSNYWNSFFSQGGCGLNLYNQNDYYSSIFGLNSYQSGYNSSIKSSSSVSPKNDVTKSGSTVPQKTYPKRKGTDSSLLAESFVSNAVKYIGYNEADGSYKKFTNSTEWCADFVTYVVKESYKKQGLTPPSWFGSSRCEDLKQQAIDHNKFLKTAGMKNKELIVRRYVTPGDIVILRENGASHVGIVKEINRKNGEFITIEGNIPNEKGNDSVLYNSYMPNDPEISGFIQLS